MDKRIDAARFSRCMIILEKYFEKTLGDAEDDSIKQLYFDGLSDLSIEEIEQATRRAIATLRFFPKIAELRELVEGTKEDRAAIAWESALQAHRKAGAWSSVIFSDAATGEALKTVFGGWVEFCESVHQVWTSDAGFEDRDDARLARREAEGYRRLVSGLSDEMLTAKRKEFLVAYRNAARAGRKPFCYLPGQHEIANRRTAGTWTRGELGETFQQRVYISDHLGGYFVIATFDSKTAQLLDKPTRLLAAEPVHRPSLPASQSGPQLLRAGSPHSLSEAWIETCDRPLRE